MRSIDTSTPPVAGRLDAAPEGCAPDSRPSGPSRGGASPKKPRSWGLWLFLVLAVLGASVWLARAAIVTRVERQVVARLAEDGIYLRYGQRTWSLGSGLHLENVVLRRAAKDDRPVVEISSLNIGAPLLDILATRDLISTWRTYDATLTLHDDTGPLTFQHVTAILLAGSGRLDLFTLQGRQGTLALDLPGKIKLPAPDPNRRPDLEQFRLDLSTLRQIAGVLAIQPSTQTFHVRGRWALDVSNHADPVWQAELSGSGSDLEWKGVPLRTVEVKGRVAQTGLELEYNMQLTTGSAQGSLSLADWDSAPLVFAGKLADAAGAVDEFSGRYEGTTQKLFVDRIAGKADLLSLARGLPALAPHVPDAFRVSAFPDLELRDFSASFATGALGDWQLTDVQVRGPTSLVIVAGSDPMQIAFVEGRASFLDKVWKVRAKTGPSSWRDVQVRAATVDADLTGGLLKSHIVASLPRGSAELSVATNDYRNAALEFSGSLKDSRGRADRVDASYQPRTAAWQIAKLEGGADLLEFAGNFPSLPAKLPSTLSLRSPFPEIAVRDFNYRPGQAVTIGSFKLVDPTDLTITLQKGRSVPIDNLTGQVAFDGRLWKLTSLSGRLGGGQARVDGIYQDGTLRDATVSASKIHVAQLKPWLESVQDSRAVLSFDYRGSLSVNDPVRIAGSGHVRLENAPIVKIPLLDQTYALFSALTTPIDRKGDGSLDATFAASGGVVKVSEFVARSDSARVTATGTIDLKKRVVDARARGNIRGIFGLATRPLARALEMQVSGPLDQLRVRPLGFDNVLTGTLAGTAELLPSAVKKTSRLTGDMIRNGVSLPLRAFNFLTPEKEDTR